MKCRKTKTKTIVLANHKEHAQYSEPVRIELITQENACERLAVGCDFSSDWTKNRRYCLEPFKSQSRSAVSAKPIFSTLKWQLLKNNVFTWELSNLLDLSKDCSD